MKKYRKKKEIKGRGCICFNDTNGEPSSSSAICGSCIVLPAV